MQTPHRGGRHGSQSQVYAGDPLVQKRLDHAGNQMCTMDKQHMSTPQHHKENENLFGGGEQNGNDHPNIHVEQSI